jgi:uncharacterized protein (TIGR02147 family)
VQSATLSAVLKKSRHLSFKDAEAVSLRLFHDPEESRKFILHYLQEKALEKEHQFLPEDPHYFPVIAEWEYRAVLTLMDTLDFQPSPAWISRRLDIPHQKTKEVISHLKKIGLLKQSASGAWTKALTFAETSDDVSSLAIKHAHKNELNLALKKQQEVDLQDRDFESLCFAVEKKNIPKIKKQIRDFIRQLERTYETKDADEVYFFCSQLFPATKDVSNEK